MLQLIPVLEVRDFGWIDPETNIKGLYQTTASPGLSCWRPSMITLDRLRPPT